MSNIGILGGTFDPIHNGHIMLAKEAYKQYNLDKIWVMVSKTPPHKAGKQITSAISRLAMVKLAIADFDYMEASDFELKREGYIYTADTLTLLEKAYPEDKFFFIIGGDSLNDFKKWYHPEIILSKAVVLAATRDNMTTKAYEALIEDIMKDYEQSDPDIRRLNTTPINIASHTIRDNIAQNTAYNAHINPLVLEYIKANHLYGLWGIKMNDIYDKDFYKDLRKKLKKELSSSRFEHTLGVEFTSSALAMRYGFDIHKAKIAGLLHDCAKCIDDDEKLSECIKNNIEVKDIERQCKFLLHAKLGAFYAKSTYDIDDTEILNAIKYHTTGRPEMTLLEKIVFVADYIEPARDKSKNLYEIRQMSFIDINKAIFMILTDTLDYLKQTSDTIDDATLSTYNYYKEYLERS